jgi:glycosyltransferase 2 family protein
MRPAVGPTFLVRVRAMLLGQMRNIVGFAISAACIAFMAWQIDFQRVGVAIASFKWLYLLVGLAALTCDYSMRILRWSIMLDAAGAHTSFARCAAPFLGSIALNNVLPARLGDVIRAFVFPSALGITKVASTGSLVLERLLDLATLLCLLTLALLAFPTATVPESIKLSASTLAVLTFVGLISVVVFSGLFASLALYGSERDFGKRTVLVRKILLALHALLLGFRAMSRPRVLSIVVILSVLVWTGEALFFWSFLVGFGISTSPAAAALAMTIATLATMVPSSPGYIGPFHLAAYAATTILGSSPEISASFAVLAHAGIWLPTTFVGAVAILSNPGLFAGRKKILSNSAEIAVDQNETLAAPPR